MDRLTKRVDGHAVFPSELVGATLLPDNPVMSRLLNALADYEDAEEQGRLVRLKDDEEFVRCRDCKHAVMTYSGEAKYCREWAMDDAVYLPGDYFCASGKRKDETQAE